jgi:hypothetical protein
MIKRVIYLLLLLLLVDGSQASAQFAQFQASSPSAPAGADVVCTFTTGDCTGTGGGSGLFTAGTCNGSANDTASFNSFVTWAVGTWQASHTGLIELFIPSGSDCVLNQVSAPIVTFKGIKRLVVSGYGASINGVYNHLAGETYIVNNTISTRVQAVSLGATQVTVNPTSSTQPAASCQTLSACASLFTVGQYALLAGFDLQHGTGFPPNQFYFDYVLISAVNTTTGVVTFTTTPTTNAYKTTWPNFFQGDSGSLDAGGPATLYALWPEWDIDIEWKGLTFNQSTSANYQVDASGRLVTFTDTTWTKSGQNTCVFPTANQVFTIVNSMMTGCQMEFDKSVKFFSMSGSTLNSLVFQSSSASTAYTISNSTIFNIVGTPYDLTITGSAINGQIVPGTQYGYAKSLSITTSSVNSLTGPGGVIWNGTNGGNNGFDNFATMTAGVIAISKAYLNTGTVSVTSSSWMAPGANLCWTDDLYGCATIFQVTDVTDDATNVYVHTSDVTRNAIPSWSYVGALGVRSHPAPVFTCTSCFGVANAPAGSPLWSYYSKVWDNANGSGFGYYIWGNIATISANVTAAYTGATTPASDGIRPGNAIDPSTFAVNNYLLATVDLRTGGSRTLDTSGGYPASWGGVVGTDNLPNLTSAAWITNQFYNTLTDLSGDPSHPFSILVTVTTNQGVVVPP